VIEPRFVAKELLTGTNSSPPGARPVNYPDLPAGHTMFHHWNFFSARNFFDPLI
jgi:hypothetical protein